MGNQLEDYSISFRTCLDNECWKSIKPLGMNVSLLDEEIFDGGLIRKVTLEIIHPKILKRNILHLHLPIFFNNIITWRNSKKALLFKGDILIDSDFDIDMGDKNESERMDLHITSPYIIANRNVEAQLANGIRNWFYDSEPDLNEDLVQLYVDKWFASGKEWRVLKYSRIAQEDQNNGIILDLAPEDSSHNVRMMSKVFNSDLWNTIDLNSTSISDKVNESFRFINGTYYENKVLCPPKKETICCKILDKHAIGLGMNPRRAYLLRNTFEQVVDLVQSDYPKVSPYKLEEENVLHGLNLLTAVMHLKHYTHEDSIAISESAAEKFTAISKNLLILKITITQLIESNTPITVYVKEGDEVSPNSIIASDGDNKVLASKLYYPGKIAEVSITKGNRFGIATNRAWFKYESYYPLCSGDKLSNRHGGKGVVVIVPDQEMPTTSDKRIVDICIGPETITNRKAMSILWEMMLSNKAISQKRGSIRVNLLEEKKSTLSWPKDENHNFSKLAAYFTGLGLLSINNDL